MDVQGDAVLAYAASVIMLSAHTAVTAWLKIDGFIGRRQLHHTTFGLKQIRGLDQSDTLVEAALDFKALMCDRFKKKKKT